MFSAPAPFSTILSLILFNLFFIVPATAKAELKTPQARLTACLAKQANSRYARWGVAIGALDHETLLFSQNAHLRFNPASNVKLLVAAAAMEQLGPRFRFSTTLYGRLSRGAIRGGLYLQGNGDPALNTFKLKRLARRLKKMGVRSIYGPVYFDESYYPGPIDPPGYRRFRSSHAYRAGVGALSLNHNVIRIVIKPGEKIGQPAQVTLSPPSPYLEKQLRIRTTGRRSRFRVVTFGRDQKTWVKVSGQINIKASPQRLWRRVFHPARYFAYSFAEALRSVGIRVDNRIGKKKTPAGVPELFTLRSPPLATLLHREIKASSNFIAEQVYLALGVAHQSPPASYYKSRLALTDYFKKHGIDDKRVFIENGSGLSRNSSVELKVMISLLQATYKDLRLQPELLTLLPIAGLDGTLRRSYRNDAVRGMMRAKTGTLNRVRALSGYLGDPDNHVLAFSLIAHRKRKGPQLRWQQHEMILCLKRYLEQKHQGPP